MTMTSVCTLTFLEHPLLPLPQLAIRSRSTSRYPLYLRLFASAVLRSVQWLQYASPTAHPLPPRSHGRHLWRLYQRLYHQHWQCQPLQQHRRPQYHHLCHQSTESALVLRTAYASNSIATGTVLASCTFFNQVKHHEHTIHDIHY